MPEKFDPQLLRNENNRLKGEQGKPAIKPNKEDRDDSSEKERESKPPSHAKSVSLTPQKKLASGKKQQTSNHYFSFCDRMPQLRKKDEIDDGCAGTNPSVQIVSTFWVAEVVTA